MPGPITMARRIEHRDWPDWRHVPSSVARKQGEAPSKTLAREREVVPQRKIRVGTQKKQQLGIKSLRFHLSVPHGA